LNDQVTIFVSHANAIVDVLTIGRFDKRMFEHLIRGVERVVYQEATAGLGRLGLNNCNMFSTLLQ
jgi:hypothetical protein